MNLYTVADGLFGTHVTWTEIEEDMQRELDTVATFGPNKTAKDIGEGNGAPLDHPRSTDAKGVISFVQGFHEEVRPPLGGRPGDLMTSHGFQSVTATGPMRQSLGPSNIDEARNCKVLSNA
ncbi:unnamed protein product [Heligmosomoides polygyrus]|uniref:Reverse transcriptase n=1 Tax=Heligmosomoides polygyrus TaxID=6339 RepID=A0A183FF83_HELPZ|nr:unnamed protein product [Heligmosomoides polygyrus]